MNAVELPLKHVTVLTDGAILTHIGKIELAKGEQIVTLTKLSEYLDSDSVRVKGKGKITLIDVAPRLEYIEIEDKDISEIDLKIKKIEKKIVSKEREMSVIEISMNTLNETIQEIGKGFGEWGLRKGLTASDFDSYYEYYQKGARAEKAEEIKIENEIEDLQEEVNILRAKKNQLSHSDSQYYEVDITLDVQTAGLIELEVGYSISQARWDPLYIVDLLKETASVQRLAKIYNFSGFDWKNVNIIVTTGTRKPVSIDTVSPFYLRLAPLYSPKRKKMTRAVGGAAMKSKMALDDFAPEMEEAPAPMAVPVPKAPGMVYRESDISISQTGHQRFELSGKHTIPSGNIPKTLHLDHFDLKLEKSYYWSSTQPKLIMTHELENDQYFLLPGNAKVFIAGEYISQSYLDTIHPKEKFTLGIIESYDLKIDKKLIHREVQKKGLIRGKREMDFGYEIKIQNQIETLCKLKLIDRFPHSLDENIDVEINNLNIDPLEKNQGVYEWEFELKKEEEIKIIFDYSVRCPPDRKLNPPL